MFLLEERHTLFLLLEFVWLVEWWIVGLYCGCTTHKRSISRYRVSVCLSLSRYLYFPSVSGVSSLSVSVSVCTKYLLPG